ncbi:MAG: L-fuculokinase [Mangrovibacterium sp.]
MIKDIAIVLDCGATNVRCIAMDSQGQIVASKSAPNETDADALCPDGRIWDLEKLWGKLCNASKEVISAIDTQRIAGVTVTTFGVDGALVDEAGKLLYPVISWQCPRTAPIMENIGKYIPLEKLYHTTGVYPYNFNTINKLIWLKENQPELIKSAHRFLFIPSLLIHKLSGAFVNDASMLGTSMFSDLSTRKPSAEVLEAIGIDEALFGEIGEAGQQVGMVNEQAFSETGIPTGTPVLLAGHDTQFAIFGSGAEFNQPVLSSGTWEILMARSKSCRTTSEELQQQLTTELDAIAGGFNIGQNWLGSGVLEWFSKNFYPELKGNELYEQMISDAEAVLPGCEGVSVDAAFHNDGANIEGGAIKGLTIATTRAQIYRAFLESLACRLRESLEILEKAGEFKAESIICVGGGSKNRLWNQLRANICQVPIHLIEQKETTVLGASLFVFAGTKVFDTIEAARQNVLGKQQVITPDSTQKELWEQLYQQYVESKKQSTC